MNKLSIANYIVGKLNTPELLSVCKDLVARNYERIYNEYNFRDEEYRYDDILTAATQDLTLNSNISRAVSVLANGRLLDPITAVTALQYDPTLLTRQGD